MSRLNQEVHYGLFFGVLPLEKSCRLFGTLFFERASLPNLRLSESDGLE